MSGKLRLAGALCTVGLLLFLADLAYTLHDLPAQSWWPDGDPRLSKTSVVLLTSGWVDLGPSWFAYVASWIWLAVAIRGGVRSDRVGGGWTRMDWGRVLVVATLLVGVTAIVHLTPLHRLSLSPPVL